jgi:hypothetical protein
MLETNLMKGSNDPEFVKDLMHTFLGAQVGKAGAMYNHVRAEVLPERQFLPFGQSARVHRETPRAGRIPRESLK